MARASTGKNTRSIEDIAGSGAAMQVFNAKS